MEHGGYDPFILYPECDRTIGKRTPLYKFVDARYAKPLDAETKRKCLPCW
jgi:hypothetical protein